MSNVVDLPLSPNACNTMPLDIQFRFISHSTFARLVKIEREAPLQANKERTPSQISEEARPSAFGEIWKRRAKWGHTISPIHFTQPSTQPHQRILVVFFRSQIHSYAYHLSLDAMRTPRLRRRIFRCGGIRFIPRVSKSNVPTAFAARTRKEYHISPTTVKETTPQVSNLLKGHYFHTKCWSGYERMTDASASSYAVSISAVASGRRRMIAR